MTRSPNSAGPQIETSLSNLREQLLALRPAGHDGFEGLVATALADLTKLTFRLARSGSQFGRDATSPRGRFAIAIEAKRYGESLRLEDVAGKIWVASNELASDVDLWVLCATSEMGDGVLAKLELMLEERGISLLMLDWTNAPLPRLAVLLAAAREKVIQWFEAHTSSPIASEIGAALTAIEKAPAFVSARNQLKEDASAGHSGLAALAEINHRWCGTVFSERTTSKRTLGQYLTVSDSAHPAIARPSVDAKLDEALSNSRQEPDCVAILGPEGTGKSWLAARWWVRTSDKPILIIGGAQATDLITPNDPPKTLAKLIAAQGGGNPAEDTQRWSRRLQRWRDHAPTATTGQYRFLIILDGLNEKSGMPWAETILQLAPEVHRLGGRMLVTCRERYWEREIAPRLAGVPITPVQVGDYTPAEQEELLRQNRINVDAIPDHLRGFIRNPRICSVALDLLDRLSAQPDELTVERLLLEYWRRRLEERGDRTAHTIRDFDKLLRSHARALLKNPGVQFDRDDWREHSGAARRDDGRSVENDLTDIEEGAFLRVVEERDGYYEFKPETTPYALGLLIAHELKDELRDRRRHPAEVIDGIIEEVQGFDLIGDALRAAAGIACFETNYPANGRAALVSAWLNLQNIPDSSFDSLAAYAATRPQAVLDAMESVYDEHSLSRRWEWLIDALLDKRDRPQVESELKPRIRSWLGRWSRKPRQTVGDDEQEKKALRKRETRIAERLTQLTAAEREFMDRTCCEVDPPESTQLDGAAAQLMAGRPLADYAEGILAWAFAWALTGDYRRADDELEWIIRLNNHDFHAFEQRLKAAIDALLSAPHSDVGKRAAAIALDTLGTLAASEEAERLWPHQPGKGWRLVEQYCETDPFDPSSSRPSNITNAIEKADGIEPCGVWNHRAMAMEDHDLEYITPGMARFEPEPIVRLLRSISSTAMTRAHLAARQLSFELQRFSPLFDAETLASVLAGYKRLIEHPELIADNDKDFVTGSILLSLLPHFPAAEQLQLYLDLPDGVAEWYKFRDLFAPLSSAEADVALSSAESNPTRLKRTLFFISAHRHTLTDRSRGIIGRSLEHDEPIVVACASDAAYIARDPALDKRIIEAARRRSPDPVDSNSYTFERDRAVAAAIVSLKRYEDIPLVAPRFVGYVAGQLHDGLNERLEEAIESTIDRLLNPIRTPEPQLARIYLEVDEDERKSFRNVRDRSEEESGGSITDFMDRMAKRQEGIDTFAERQKVLNAEVDTYLEHLARESAQALTREPDLTALRGVASRNLDKALSWANQILSATEENPSGLSAVRNFALGLAQVLADDAPDCAASLLHRFMEGESPITIVIGDARIPQEFVALFSGPDENGLRELREQALNGAATDAELEMRVFAAEAAGHGKWLEEWIDQEIASGVPGRIARALTVEGFRNSDTETSPRLSRDWGTGFLGQVAKHARDAYARNQWAKHWCAETFGATDPVDFWRWSELTSGIADIRSFHWFSAPETQMMARFGDELFTRLRQSAKKRSDKRKDKLFGLKAPQQALSQLIIP